MTNSSVGFPQFYQIQQILDRFLDYLAPVAWLSLYDQASQKVA
ncbi:hypothetical protein [Lacticaseibacillus paracasei]|nr:hypothetical protein [Lacticaseibacillus paracasei]